MKQINCADGITITVLDSEKFKRCRISINFIWENKRSDATSSALLPYLMERGYSDCPDMTELSKKLSALYGAELSVNVFSSGANRVLTVSVCGINDKFALDNENLSNEYLELALGIAFRPNLDENGLFPKALIDIEREKLRETLESEINEKRSYCIRQARRRFFENLPEGVEAGGYLDEVDSITPQSVTQAYSEMLAAAQIELIILDIDENSVREKVLTVIKGRDRTVRKKAPPSAQPPVESKYYEQPVDAVQGKLCLMFTSGKVIPKEDFTKVRVAVALLGATPTSRLFVNVREKQSLCYYCAASYAYTTGVMCIDSGIEHCNAQKAKDAVLIEIDKLKNEEITQTELKDTQRCIINSIKSMNDSLAGLESWYFGEIMRGTLKTPQQIIDEINAVNIDDIKKAISYFTLSVEYVLTQKGTSDE